MSKIAEQKALEAYPICNCYNEQCMMQEDVNIESRTGYEEGYDQALCDIKQRVKEIINNQEKEWGVSNVDIGLYTILGHIVEMEEL